MNEFNTQDESMDESGEFEETTNDEFEADSEDEEFQENQEETLDSQEEAQEETPQLTEKGTKLDPNPQSALHQQLANERRARLEAEERMLKIAQQFQQTQTQQPQEEQKPFLELDKLKTPEDIVNAFNQLHSMVNQSVSRAEKLEQVLQQNQAQSQEYLNLSNFSAEIAEVRSSYPELDENNKEFYNKALDSSLTKMYMNSAYDSQGRLLSNRPSFKQFADYYMEGIRQAQQVGSQRAQTNVQRKVSGKIVTSQKPTKGVPTSLSPEASLAREMERMGF
jgi:hypothetical protein